MNFTTDTGGLERLIGDDDTTPDALHAAVAGFDICEADAAELDHVRIITAHPALAAYPRLVEKIVTLPNGCWVWAAALDRGGYGAVKRQGRVDRAHRVVFEAAGRVIPPGKMLRHGPCNLRCCVRPDHVSPGTHADNMQDRHRDGTMVQAKLSAKIVTDCRRRHRLGGVSIAALARAHGVGQWAMQRAIQGGTWKHLAEPPVPSSGR